MSKNERTFPFPLHTVEQALLDANIYPRWIVGVDECESINPPWPKEGGSFRYVVKVGPLRFRDETTMVKHEPGREIHLIVSMRPFGAAKTILRYRPAADGGTVVELTEEPVSAAGRRLWNVLADRMLGQRNEISLDRLEPLLEKRAGRGTAAGTGA